MDARWFLDINRFAIRTGWAHPFMKFDAGYGVGLFVVAALGAWWFARYASNAPRAVAAVGWTVLGTAVAVGVNQPLARAFHRARPFVAFSHAEVLVAKAHDYSFPSDHAVTAGAVTVGIWLVARYSPRVRPIALVTTLWAVLLCFARVYVGVHYPGDVLAGFVVGALVMDVGWFVLRGVLTTVVTLIEKLGPLRVLVRSRSPR